MCSIEDLLLYSGRSGKHGDAFFYAFFGQLEPKAIPSIASNAAISGIGRLVVASHSRGRLVCSNDDTLTALDSDALLTVFPYLGEKTDDHSLQEGMFCFEIADVSIGGIAVAGSELIVCVATNFERG
jgi:hypothetical protein